MTNKQAGSPRHSEATKRQAAQESYAGNTVVAVAKKYSVSANTLQNWRKAYPQTGALSAPRIRSAARTTIQAGGADLAVESVLRAQVMDLRNENELLRKILIDQELRHRGYTPSGIQAAQTIIPETIRPNGALSATN